MDDDDLTIRDAQKRQPWTIPYSWDGLCTMNSFEVAELQGRHALFHAQKSLGKIAAVYEKVDHRDRGSCPMDDERRVIEAMAADLMSIALRFANVYKFDLCSVLRRRVKEKNGVGY